MPEVIEKMESVEDGKVVNILYKEDLTFPLPSAQITALFKKLTKAGKRMEFDTFSGVVSALEIPNHSNMSDEELFKQVDISKSGDLTQDEFTFLIQYLSFHALSTKPNFSAEELFQLFDWKNTGEITREEFNHFLLLVDSENGTDQKHNNQKAEIFQDIFNKIDADGSGRIDFQEWVIGFFKHKLFEVLNVDADKIHVSKNEFQVLVSQHDYDVYEANLKFFEIDMAQTGYLDSEEIEAYIAVLEERASWQELLCNGDMLLIFIIFIFVVMLSRSVINNWGLGFEELHIDALEVIVGCGEMYLFFSLLTEEAFEAKRLMHALAEVREAFNVNMNPERSFSLYTHSNKS